MSFFDQPVRVTRFRLVHAVWRRQRMEMLPGVAPVSLLLAFVCLAGTRDPRGAGRDRRRAGPGRSRGGGAVLLRGTVVRPNDLDWPCHNVVPATAPVAAILARTDQTVVAVTGIRAFPPGSAITAAVRCRPTPSG